MNQQPIFSSSQQATTYSQFSPIKTDSSHSNSPSTQQQAQQNPNNESNDNSELATLRLMILQRDYIIRNYYSTIMSLQSQIHALTSGRSNQTNVNFEENPFYLGHAGSSGGGGSGAQGIPPAMYPYHIHQPSTHQPQSTANFQQQKPQINTFLSSHPAQKKSPPHSPKSPNTSSELSISEESHSASTTPESKLYGGKFSEYIANLKTICSECSQHGRLKSKKKPLVDSLLLLSFFQDGVHKNEHGGYQIDNENVTREKMNSISVLIRPPSRGTNHSYENWKRAMGKTFKKDGNTFTPKDENARRYIAHVEEHLQKISTAKKLAEASMELEQ